MPKNLLLADDSITIQKVVGITFAQEDYDITYVDNGEDAIKKAKEINPDIILADIIMPQKNGYEVCEQIKKDPSLSTTPVLLLAGTFETFDETRGKNAGADGYIIKPFESQALIDKVNSLVEKTGKPQAATPIPPVQPQQPQAQAPQPQQPQAQAPQPQQPQAQAPQPQQPQVQPPMPETQAPAQQQQEPPAQTAPVPKPEQPKSEEVPMPDMVTIPPEPIAQSPDTPEITTPPSEPPEVDKRMEPMLEKDFPSPDLSQPEPMANDAPDAIDLSLSDPKSKPVDLASPADFIMDATAAADEPKQEQTDAVQQPDTEFPDPAISPPEPPAQRDAPETQEQPFEVEKPPSFDFVSGESDLSPEPAKTDDQDFASFPDLGEPLSSDEPDSSEPFPAMDEPQDVPSLQSDEQIPSQAEVRSAVEKSEEVTSAASKDDQSAAASRIPEDQMEELVKRISQNIIEKIAWEVVPDMAERIIKDEIKRLTDEEKK